MKELSVVVLGDGRWARALTFLLTHNQKKQRGRISRVFTYVPPPGSSPVSAAPAPLPTPVTAESHDSTMQLTASALAGLAAPVPGPLRVHVKSDSADATMMHMTADALAALGAPVAKTPKVQIKSESNDATMMGMTAESLASLAGLGAPVAKGPKVQIKSESNDATMMGMTAESLASLAGLGAPAAKGPKVQIKSESNDATMMGMTAESLASLAGLGAPAAKAAKTQIKSESNDATMMAMTAESLAGLTGLGAPVAKGPKVQIKSESNDATMMGMTAESLAGLSGVAAAGSSPKAQVPRTSLKSSSEDSTMMHMTAESLAGAVSKNSALLAEVGTADMILLAVPASAVLPLLRHVSSVLRPTQMMVHCVDGFHPADPEEGLSAMLISQVIRQETPITRIGALAGPALPEDLEEWCPVALVCGSTGEAVSNATRQVLGCPTMRIYNGNDLVGVEVARAMASVVAFASGICDVLEFGIASRATLVSRISAEIARIGTALGGVERTFVGLAGIGGLMVASERRDSLDFRLGRLIGAGVALPEASKQLGESCDATNMVRDAYGVTQAYGLRAPILVALHRMVFGKNQVAEALRELLENPNFQE